MAGRPRGYTRPRFGSSGRSSEWGFGPQVDNQTLSANGKLLWNVGVVPADNNTIIRTRGEVMVTMLTGASASAGFEGAHGIYMMTSKAFAIGVTAALDPLEDATSEMWLWHSFWNVHLVTATISDGVNARSAVHRAVIDSKAMRKDFDAERVLVGVTGVIEVGTATAVISGNSRVLVLQ